MTQLMDLLDSVIQRLLETIDPNRFVSTKDNSLSPEKIAAKDQQAIADVLPALEILQSSIHEPWTNLPRDVQVKLRLVRLLVASLDGPIDPTEALQTAKLFEAWNNARNPLTYFGILGYRHAKHPNEVRAQISGVLDTLILAQEIVESSLYQCFYGCWRYFAGKALGPHPDTDAIKAVFYLGELRIDGPQKKKLNPPKTIGWLNGQPKFCKALFETQRATLRELVNGSSIDAPRGDVYKFAVQVYSTLG